MQYTYYQMGIRAKTSHAHAPITQTTIAQLTGVSQGVVSAVLNENFTKIRVAPAVQQRVRNKAQALGYRINAGARAMRTRRYFNVGYFLANTPGTMAEIDFPEFRAGAYDAAVAQDYHVSLIRLPSTVRGKINPIPKAFREAHLDALVINQMGGGFTTELHRSILASGFPVVYLNDKQPTNALYFDDFKSAQLLTEHLIKQGYRRIQYLAEPVAESRHYSTMDRREGYMATMTAHGLTPTFQTLDPDAPRDELIRWLRGAQKPEAIFCSRDRDALLLQTYAYAAGLRIPEDLAVASGSNERRLDDYFIVPLTTMIPPRYEMATAAIKMVLSMVGTNVSHTQPAIDFTAELRVGASTPERA